MKREIMFENYKDSFFNDKIISKSQQRFKCDYHEVYTKEVNKIALISNGDKRLQTFDKVITYPYGTNEIGAWESKMMTVRKIFAKNYADCPFYYEAISIRNKNIQSMLKRNVK